MAKTPVVYRGFRSAYGAIVDRTDGVYIKERNDIVSHSNGLEWGYGGSGPAQCAIALLMDTLEDYGEISDKTSWALNHYQTFKWDVIARLSRTGWLLPQDDVHAWISQVLVQENPMKVVCND